MGRAWYDAGRQLHKKNSFTRFHRRHARIWWHEATPRKDKVFAMGGSAGGLLMGAVANMSPADYRGIVAQVPFVDVVTTMLDDSIPLTTNEYDEWGNPDATRSTTITCCPIRPTTTSRAQAYPSMFVTTGCGTARCSTTSRPSGWPSCAPSRPTSNPLLLHVDMEAGHGGKSGRFQRYREIAMEYAFLLDQSSEINR